MKEPKWETVYRETALKYLTAVIEDVCQEDSYGIRYIDYFPELREELIEKLGCSE